MAVLGWKGRCPPPSPKAALTGGHSGTHSQSAAVGKGAETRAGPAHQGADGGGVLSHAGLAEERREAPPPQLWRGRGVGGAARGTIK